VSAPMNNVYLYFHKYG